MNFLEFITGNLGHTLPLLIVGGAAIAITIERSQALFMIYPMKDEQKRSFLGKLTELILANKLNEASQLCEQYPHKPLAQMVKAAIARAHLSEEVIHHGIQYSVGESNQMINKRTSFLATIANVATLLGLFGTILGLIHSFEAVAHADPQQKSALLSAGIATAMNATMLGLGIAIPSMIAFSMLVNKSNRIVADLENSSVRVLELLKQRYLVAAEEAERDTAPTRERKAA